MYAFVIQHFGNNKKYLEYELYLIFNLKNNTKYDIIYLYSINDTPKSFIDIIKKYVILEPYDDNNITYNIKNFSSYYKHFNTLRTCNFLFSYKLTKYKKICLIESDTIILQNIDNIFDLNVPAILSFYDKNKLKVDIYNNKKKLEIDFDNTLSECSKSSTTNGGVILIKPSKKIYNLLLKNIKYVIENNCMYPNETLFLISNKYVYNLPFSYNSMYHYVKNNDINIIHFNAKEYKHIDIIRDNYLEKEKKKNIIIYNILVLYKKFYYDKYNIQISNLLKSI